MLLLFTFVILGSSLIWTGFNELNWPTVIFVAFAMLIRIPVYLLSLIGSRVDRRGRALIAWFGPSGLSSLLLVLLPVFAGLPGSERIFAVCSLVVLLSVVIHGTSPMLLARFCKPKQAEAPEPETRALPVIETPPAIAAVVPDAPLSAQADLKVGSQIITLEELKLLQDSGEPVIILDVRTERSIEGSDTMAQGAIRMPPEHVVDQARERRLPKEAWLIAYCA
jgi:hypothetical protein